MMAKCIKLDDLIPLLDWDHDEQAWYINPEELEHLEENAIDVAPVVHARFGFVGPDLSVYRYDTRYGTCSACKRRIVFVPNQTNFCPNCGARMDAEGDT